MSDLAQRFETAPSRAQTITGTSDFDLHPDLKLPATRKLTPAAVLVALDEAERVVLTMRSARLRHHPGQIAFPGGKQDQDDGNPTATALREAREEIGLPAGRAQVLGSLPPHETVTGFQVTPVLARIGPFDPQPEIGEVAEIFRVPLSFLADQKNYTIESRHWQGTKRSYYTIPYGPYYIWGATARMLRALAEVL